MSYNMDQAILSSPDPLNDSPTFSSPAKPITAGIRRSLPIQNSSPRKQTFQLDVGDKLSPQKIRVTVEAEDSDNGGNNGHKCRRENYLPSYRGAPIVRQTVRTTTTTVPVKGLSDSEDDLLDSPSEKPTRGRSRPRKSFGTPIPTKTRNRAVTPGAKSSPRRRRTLGDLIDGDDPDDWDFAIGDGVEVRRGKGRSRSKSVKGARNKGTPAAKQISSPDKTVSSTTSKKGRGRRKTLTPEEIIIHEDEVEALLNTAVQNSDTPVGVSKVLAQRDINVGPIQPAHSTSRPTTATADDYPDILLNKFSPAKKALVTAGRSSPRILSAKISSPTVSRVDIPPARTMSPAKSPMQHVTDVKASYSHEDEINDTSNGVGEDAVDRFQEFDTILESEGFSMISVDSVPSLREHLSSPYGSDQHGPESGSTVVNGNVSHLKNGNIVGLEDSFSSIAPEILEAATPGRKATNPILRAVRSVNNPEDGDSFSSIPPEILEAATPGRQRPSNKFLSVKIQDRKSNDDSFSSVPLAVLEAATPAKYLHADTSLPKPQSGGKEESNPIATYPLVTPVPLQEAGRQSLASSGLLTPNETPSPQEITVQYPPNIEHSKGKTPPESRPDKLPSTERSSMMNLQIRSSPPSAASRRFTYSAHQHQQRSLYPNLMETPSIVFSSPSLPPLIQRLPLNGPQTSSRPDSHEPSRPSLSPAVRAGRVLQDIAISPSSRSRTQSLGSPFKSPAAQRKPAQTSTDGSGSTGVIGKSQKPPDKSKGMGGNIFVGFSDDTRRELRKSLTMGEELALNQKRSTQMTNPSSASQGEDPFHSDIQPRCSLSPEEEKEFALDLPSQKRDPGKEYDQLQDSVYSDSVMSWQAENAVTLQNSVTAAGAAVNDRVRDSAFETTDLLEKSREVEWARQRAVVSSQIDLASTSQVIIINSDPPEASVGSHGVVDDAEEDIWQAEARHSSSLVEEQCPKDPPMQGSLEEPRRSRIPSPWRKHSKRLVYSDKHAQLSSPPKFERPKALPTQAQLKASRNPARITVRKRVSTQDVNAEEDMPEPSIMWHIPQKLNFAPRPRNSGNLDLSALLGSSPLKMPQSASQANVSRNNGSTFSNADPGRDCSVASDEDSRLDSLGPVEKPLSNDNSIQDESSIESTSASYEKSELISEPSHMDTRVHYPALPQTTPPMSHKSCLRTPTSTSPTKSVAFVSPTPSSPPLSASTWSKAHWKLLNNIYQDSKSLPSKESQDSVEPSMYLGKTIYARGVSLTLEQWHLDIVGEFREEVPGWDEGIIAKRLFAIIVGEDLRRQGKVE